MSKRKLFLWLSAASGYVGAGMLLGYGFSDHAINTALWVGVLLVIAASVLMGMYISARNDRPEQQTAVSGTPPSSKAVLSDD